MRVISEKENFPKPRNIENIIRKISVLIEKQPTFKLKKRIEKLDNLEPVLIKKDDRLSSLLEKVIKYRDLFELEIKKIEVVNLKKRNKLIEILENYKDGEPSEDNKNKRS